MSASRNPRDLKDMISDSQDDMNDMQVNLAKLRGLSTDDKTENALLRSRIDDQSQLIMILKQRVDESTIRIRTLERINNDLEEFRNTAAEDLEMQMKKCEMLDSRFNDLAHNHEEMILIKDDYKNRNKFLMKENAQLTEDNARLFSKAIEERDSKIVDLDQKVAGFREKCMVLDQRNRELDQMSRANDEKYKQETRELRKNLDEAEERLKAANYKLQQQTDTRQQSDADSIKKLHTLTKEKDDLLELAMSRGKLIQEKQTENKKLQLKIRQMEKEVQNMKDKFDREAAAVNVNLQVRRLRGDLEDVDDKYEDAIREFDAYKKHSSGLLQKEKELNERLRHLMG